MRFINLLLSNLIGQNVTTMVKYYLLWEALARDEVCFKTSDSVEGFYSLYRGLYSNFKFAASRVVSLNSVRHTQLLM